MWIESIQTLPFYWKFFENLALQDALEKGLLTSDLIEEGDRIFEEFQANGYIRNCLIYGLKTHIYAFIRFYKRMSEVNSVTSPIIHRNNTDWMFENDFCSINIRSLNLEFEKTGNFFDGIKVLPYIRPANIHLLPFFDCHIGSLYAIDSLEIICDECIDIKMLEKGLKRNDQLRIFIDSAHLLKKTVGFDLLPHTQQFSRIVFEHPEFFRWIHLSEDKTSLYHGLSQKQMMSIDVQETIIQEVKTLVKSILDKYGMKKVEDLNFSVERIRVVHQELLDLMIEKGYWTVLSHTWAGIGVPEFDGYNFDKNYVKFLYINKLGKDHEDHAFGSLVPFRFYDNLGICCEPDTDNLPIENQATIDFYKNIFPRFQDSFQFDFVRMDYMDHVFDASWQNTNHIPATDRLIPSTIRKVIDHIKKNKPWIGVLAEGMGTSFEDYKDFMDIELLVGHNLTSNTNAGIMETNFNINKRMQLYNTTKRAKAGVLYTIDSHDSGHWLFWGKPVSEVIGAQAMAQRMFISKFISCGAAKRPRLESIGNQDLSYGLFLSNNIPRSLIWKSDREFNVIYHNISDVFENFRDLIDESFFGDEHIEENYAYWFFNGNNGRQERLLLVCFIEKFVFVAGNQFIDTEYQDIENIRINYCVNYYFNNPIIEEIDFITNQRKSVIILDEYIIIDRIKPYGFKLFHIYSDK